jgi:hypothetical protein
LGAQFFDQIGALLERHVAIVVAFAAGILLYGVGRGCGLGGSLGVGLVLGVLGVGVVRKIMMSRGFLSHIFLRILWADFFPESR